MNVMEAFPSKYLKASDLEGKEVTVKISHITMEEVGKENDSLPVMYFMGKQKGVILNKTNANNVSTAYGPETDEWAGKSVVLYIAWVDYQGRSVEAIRMRPAANGSGAVKPPVAKPAPKQTAAPAADADMDDSIPF